MLRFAYSSGHRLLLGGNGNTLKLEMKTKLKDKQTSIATVRDLLRTFATFPAPLLSHCRLPLIVILGLVELSNAILNLTY